MVGQSPVGHSRPAALPAHQVRLACSSGEWCFDTPRPSAGNDRVIHSQALNSLLPCRESWPVAQWPPRWAQRRCCHRAWRYDARRWAR
jgi:hypothetical protein